MNNVLRKESEAVTSEAYSFEMDILPCNRLHAWLQRVGLKSRKKTFTVRPLTLNQLYKISKLLLPINLENLTSDKILELIIQHSYSCAQVVAIAVTESRQTPSKPLVDMFFTSLSKNEISLVLKIVLEQMNVQNFIISIALIRSCLNVLNEVNPMDQESQIAPGILSVV